MGEMDGTRLGTYVCFKQSSARCLPLSFLQARSSLTKLAVQPVLVEIFL